MKDSPSAPATLWDRARQSLGRVRPRIERMVVRLLHPRRRQRALERLARPGAIERIVVVCYANIHRSPYAAALLARAFTEGGLRIAIEQGGFYGSGRPAIEPGRSVALARGIDLASHRSRFLVKEDFRGESLVIVMEVWHAIRVMRAFGTPRDRLFILGDLDPDPVASRSIPDPVGGAAETFVEVYDRIDRCVDELVRGLNRLTSAD